MAVFFLIRLLPRLAIFFHRPRSSSVIFVEKGKKTPSQYQPMVMVNSGCPKEESIFWGLIARASSFLTAAQVSGKFRWNTFIHPERTTSSI